MTSKYADEQKKAEDLKQENDALTESRNVYRERSVYFKKLSEKHASQFLYEQKKDKAINEKMNRYEISKRYRVWATYQKEKTKQKHIPVKKTQNRNDEGTFQPIERPTECKEE